ncbi:MAG: hypothetical protein JWM27_3287 [Gemmatimonadetes bacterium]|nr:hypothetical protein [Gemmatimonadota bacterium]
MEQNGLALQPLQDEALKKQQLETMKSRAAALLVAATVVYVVARIFEARWPWVGYVRATAEASMVGGIADWFAVTALFRYPMGVKIPHTAIIPNRKERIGRSLGNFVQNNFLSRPVITQKLRSVNVGRKLAAWLADPAHAGTVAKHVAAGATGVVQVLKDDEVQELIEQSLVSKVRGTQVAPVMGNVLAMITTGNRHQELFDSALKLVSRLVDENRDALRERISREMPWWVPTPIDDKIYQRIILGIDATMHEVAVDPAHPMRARFNDAVNEFVEKLKSSPEMIAKGEALKEDLLRHPAVRAYSASLWSDAKAWLVRHGTDPDSRFRQRIEHAVTQFGQSLQGDDELLEKVDGWVEAAVLYVVEEYRQEVADLIAGTVAAWDPDDTTRKIELQIGKDLQFIRINGTLVGGLAGLIIYAVSQFFR